MLDSKILVLDDEIAIGDMVEIILRKEGFTHIDVVTNIQKANELTSNNTYDLFILDIMLPDGSGLDLAEVIRRNSHAPIFFLTAKSSDADKLRGFMHGADDYITKPFNPMELAARVKVQLGRYISTATKKDDVLDFDVFKLDIKTATLTVNDIDTPISGKQYQLLQLFCEHPKQVFSKDQLYEQIWGIDSFVDDNTIMVHIRRLREKIEANPSRPQYLLTIRGLGYKLQVERR